MATVLENLQTAYANVAANLAAITASPKPTYTVDGESWNWQELFEAYTEKLTALKVAIQNEGGPFEVRSYGRGGW